MLSGIILFAAGHPRNAFKWGENTKRIEILRISKVPKPAEAFLFVKKLKEVEESGPYFRADLKPY